MSQVAELESVKARIRKLTERTISNGCTEAEAMAAASMVGRLLDQYSLTMDEVQMREEPCVTLSVKTDGRSRRPIDSCIVAIASFCDCMTWFSSSRAENSEYKFFGMQPDAEMAVYLYDLIAVAMRVETANYKAQILRRYSGGRLKSATTNFQRGMAHRISHRLTQEKKTRESELEKVRQTQTENQTVNNPEFEVEAVRPKMATGTSLVLVKSRIVEENFKKTKIHLTKKNSKIKVRDYDSYTKGDAAGQRINLNRPIGNSVRGVLR